MSITHAEVLAALNIRLARTETDVSEYLRAAAIHIAQRTGRLELFESISLTDGTGGYDLDAASGDVVAVTVNDGTYESGPLERIDLAELTRRRQDASGGTEAEPTAFCTRNRTIYFDPVPDTAYTATIWYIGVHGQTVTALELPEDWRELVVARTCYEYALAMRLFEDAAVWERKFEGDLKAARGAGAMAAGAVKYRDI